MKVKIKKTDGRKFLVPERWHGSSVSKDSANAERYRLEYFGLLKHMRVQTFPNPDIREVIYRDDEGFIRNMRREKNGKIDHEEIERLTEHESIYYLPEEERKQKLLNMGQ